MGACVAMNDLAKTERRLTFILLVLSIGTFIGGCVLAAINFFRLK